MYDAHIHFPMKSKNPFQMLCDELLSNSILDFMLILNSVEEVRLYLEHYEEFSKYGLRPRVALLLDVHKKSTHGYFEQLAERGINYTVKIHPRISNITKDDFILVLDELRKLNFKSVIVDCFTFGPGIENHIGVELSIYLAKTMPEKRIIIAHSGGIRILESMLLTRPLQNIYYDLAETISYFKNTSIDLDIDHFLKFTNNRIMFGSDYPDFSVGRALSDMMQHCEKCGFLPEEINKVMNDNALRIYG